MDIDNFSERSCIRDLAFAVLEIARSRKNEETIKRWRDVNALRKPDRAPVLCKPGNSWPDLLPEGDLVCADPQLKEIERKLRHIIIRNEIGDDTVVFDYTPVEAQFVIDPPNIYGLDMKWRKRPVNGGAGSYMPAIRDEVLSQIINAH